MSELYKWSASQIASAVKEKSISAREVTQAALNRLNDVNPSINAVVQEMPEAALAAADELDRKVSNGESLGTLAGVPVTIKDNIDQVGYPNTNGLRIQKDLVAERNSPVVTNFLNADAIIIGRTNTPSFSMRWFTRNSLFGHTLNSRNKKLTPGGSSGGAGSAVAAGIGAIAHGTDIAGSIRYPAYACGVHGIRPTPGRIPAVNFTTADRHIGAQLTAVSGPLTRTIEDLEMAYSAMSIANPIDPSFIPASHDQGHFNKRVALCINPEDWQVDSSIVGALTESAKKLQSEGWEVVETECPPLREPMDLQLLLWMSEYARTNGAAIAKENDPDANFVYQQLCENCPEPTMNSLMDTMQRRLSLMREWQCFLTEYPMMLCPVSSELPFADLRDINSPEDFRSILDAQLIQIALPIIGMPGLTVTTGSVGDSPVGVQMISARFREDVLFAAAIDLEKHCPTIQVAQD